MSLPKSINIVFFIALVSVFVSCTRTNPDSDLRNLDRKAILAMSTYSKDGLDSLASLLLEKATATGNRKYQGNAHFYLSYHSFNLDDSTMAHKMRHLDMAEKIAEEIGNDTLLCYVYNQRGVWELVDYNTATAQYWFKRSLDKARSLEKRFFGIPAEMNMLEACRIADDTLGIITYGRNLFEYAQSREEPLLTFVSGFHCALHYAGTAKDTSDLKPYIDAMRSQPEVIEGAIPMIYSRFFYNHGDYQKAEEAIRDVNPENYDDFLVLYAEILNKQRKYSESEATLSRIDRGMVSGNLPCQKKIMKLRINNMASVGNYKEAYIRQKEYESFRDSIEGAATRDITKRYRIEYEVYAKDREILEQQMRIRSLYIGISAIILIIIGAAVTYYLWHRRRNRFYKDIVRQNRDFIERQNVLAERIAYRDSKIAELEQSNVSQMRHSKISDKKAEEIFDKIQHLADNEQVWRDVNITRDSFADMVGCNRTYFSEVLKTRTGMGYSQFMNSCRIREAVRVLSKPEDDTPLKKLATDLGFLTIQNFYTQFKNDIGMSPSAFRKAAKE